jgi:hypothetical protein
MGVTMTKLRGEGFSVRFTRRPAFGKKSDTVMQQVKQKVFAPSILNHFMMVADRRERGFTFMLKAQKKTVADLIFKQLSQMAKEADVKQKIVPQISLEQKLLWAAEVGDCQVIRQLVLHGVDLDVRDHHGRTAMNIATQAGQTKVITTLLAAKEMRYLASLGELPETAFYKRFQRGTGTNR